MELNRSSGSFRGLIVSAMMFMRRDASFAEARLGAAKLDERFASGEPFDVLEPLALAGLRGVLFRGVGEGEGGGCIRTLRGVRGCGWGCIWGFRMSTDMREEVIRRIIPFWFTL